MKIELVTMTPKWAEQILTKNTRNFRKLRPSQVDAIASDIKDGRWHLNTSFVAIRPDGTVADGQTRLHAIVKAGIAVPLLICFNFTGEEKTIDVGNATRTAGQYVAAAGNINYNTVAAAARVYISAFVKDQVGRVVLQRCGVTTTEIVQFVESNPKLVNVVNRCCSLKEKVPVGLSMSILAAVTYRGLEVIPETTKVWFERVCTGVNLGDTDPEYQLRLRAASFASMSNKRDEVLALMIKSLNYAHYKFPCASLRFCANEHFPIIGERPSIRVKLPVAEAEFETLNL